MSSGIYRIVSPSGKSYVGSAVDFERRWRKHRNELRSGTHHCELLQRAANKYGVDALRFEILFTCERAELIAYEQSMIDTLAPEYNVARVAGSLLGFKRDATLRAKHSDTMRRKWSDSAHREKVSRAHTGNVPSAVARKRMSDSAKRKFANGFKHHASRPVKCVETGQIFDDSERAAKWLNALGFDKATGVMIARVARGERETTCGYHFNRVIKQTIINHSKEVVMPRIRMDADKRREQIIAAAYEIARKQGIRKVTRAAVARKIKVSDGLINRYCEGREGLRYDVMTHAVKQKDAKTLAAASEHYELPSMPRELAKSVKALQA